MDDMMPQERQHAIGPPPEVTVTPSSSAEALAERLGNEGVSRWEIGARHVADVYARLKANRNRGDFETVETVLSGLSPDGRLGGTEFAVIVETRDVPQLSYVIENVHDITGLPVQLFHGPANRSALATPRIAEMSRLGDLLAVELPFETFGAPLYNALFLDRRFHDALWGRGKFLVFQTDSLCCPAADFVIENFLAFDYVGARWNPDRPVGLRLHGGCGGFSVRDWHASIAAIERFPARLWPGGEDGYFAFHMDLMGCRVASPRVMAQFATQDAFELKSFGAHQIKLLPAEEHARFLQYCPQIRNVMSWRRTGESVA